MMDLLSLSKAHFGYNCTMALCSLLLPENAMSFVEANLPVKGGWFSMIAFLLLRKKF